MKIECRPISTYPVPETRTRVRAREREAVHLGCKHLVIEADFKEGQIRQDGWPKATARPSSPRVVISLLESKHGPLRYPCDTFDRFEDNVRAVGLALEALRTVDRYGVTRRGEQYAGWRALPASTEPTMDVHAAAALLHSLTAWSGGPLAILRNGDLAREAIRMAVKLTHPDRPGGTAEAFHQVQTARKVLSAHHGVSL